MVHKTVRQCSRLAAGWQTLVRDSSSDMGLADDSQLKRGGIWELKCPNKLIGYAPKVRYSVHTRQFVANLNASVYLRDILPST